MNVSREQIAQALFKLLQGVNANITFAPAKFQTISRSAFIWARTPPANQPALYLIHSGERATQNSAFGLTKWNPLFILQIYAQRGGETEAIPDTLIDGMLDGIDATLQSKPQGERQTLGGLVTNCWIEGEILFAPGEIASQLNMIVPVRVLTGI